MRQYGYEATLPPLVDDAVSQASGAEIGDLRCDTHSMGYTLLALQIGLIAYWYAEDFEEALREIIEAGGDTDTNGAIAGAFLGARFGLEAIPRRWRDQVAEIRAGRTPMESLADRLLLRGPGMSDGPGPASDDQGKSEVAALGGGRSVDRGRVSCPPVLLDTALGGEIETG